MNGSASHCGGSRHTCRVRSAWILLTLLGACRFTIAADPTTVEFETSDGGRIVGNLWGMGEHAVVLAHGAVFNKESWDELAGVLVDHGLQVLAIDFRGYGTSQGGREPRALVLDVLAAIDFLKQRGADRVSVVGGSMGGMAAAQAAMTAGHGEIDRLVLLAAGTVTTPELLPPRTLFLVSAQDSVRESVERHHAQAPEPKRLVVLPGDAHAQQLFRTSQRHALTQEIVNWLTDESPVPDHRTSAGNSSTVGGDAIP